MANNYSPNQPRSDGLTLASTESNNVHTPIVAMASGTAIIANAPAVTQVVSTAVEASHVLKNAAGSLKRLAVTSTAAGFILVMNSATVPADGAVTLLDAPIAIAAGQTVVMDYLAPLVATTGIAVCISATASFTKAIQAATCIFAAQVI